MSTTTAAYLAISDIDLDFTHDGRKHDPARFLKIVGPERQNGRVYFGCEIERASGQVNTLEWCTDTRGEGLFSPADEYRQIAGTGQFTMGTGSKARDTLTRAILSDIRRCDQTGRPEGDHTATYNPARGGFDITR